MSVKYSFLWMAAVLTLGLAGCGVQMIYTRQNGGVMRYTIGENRDANDRQRDKAYKKIHDFCNGDYRISKESLELSAEDRHSATFSSGEGKYSTFTSHDSSGKAEANWYISFDCHK